VPAMGTTFTITISVRTCVTHVASRPGPSAQAARRQSVDERGRRQSPHAGSRSRSEGGEGEGSQDHGDTSRTERGLQRVDYEGESAAV
jgi:hypothetical protein